MKRCRKCGEVKELSEFGKDRSKKDGLNSLCRDCVNQRQWKAGQPTDPETYQYIVDNIEKTEDGCWLWKGRFDRYGYGSLSHKDRQGRIHTYTLAHVKGPPPNDKQNHALHSCRNRHCCNPDHLRWGSNAENVADMVKDGTVAKGSRNGFSKLNETDVKLIKFLLSQGSRCVDLGPQFKVSRRTISNIKIGANWSWL